MRSTISNAGASTGSGGIVTDLITMLLTGGSTGGGFTQVGVNISFSLSKYSFGMVLNLVLHFLL